MHSRVTTCSQYSGRHFGSNSCGCWQTFPEPVHRVSCALYPSYRRHLLISPYVLKRINFVPFKLEWNWTRTILIKRHPCHPSHHSQRLNIRHQSMGSFSSKFLFPSLLGSIYCYDFFQPPYANSRQQSCTFSRNLSGQSSDWTGLSKSVLKISLQMESRNWKLRLNVGKMFWISRVLNPWPSLLLLRATSAFPDDLNVHICLFAMPIIAQPTVTI